MFGGENSESFIVLRRYQLGLVNGQPNFLKLQVAEQYVINVPGRLAAPVFIFEHSSHNTDYSLSLLRYPSLLVSLAKFTHLHLRSCYLCFISELLCLMLVFEVFFFQLMFSYSPL